MSKLAELTVVIGGAIALIGAVVGLIPWRARGWVTAFPRSRWAAGVLTAGGLFWAGLLLNEMSFGRFEDLKPLLWLAGPIVFCLVFFFVDELLAPRALGGILLLIPDPLLAAARWHPSHLRYVVILFAYLLVFVGMALVLSPFLFRRWVTPLVRNDTRCRLSGTAGVFFGLVLILLGLVVY
ncbi:MAG: hypothetical protein ACUVWX_05800 [Kiritimatiellia bacterium]